MSKPKIVITIEIDPPKDGGRAILVAGAPQGEIPEIRAGNFANLHPLINEVWGALQRREEMKPDPALTAAKEDKKKGKDEKDDKQEDNEDVDGESVASEETTIPDPSAEAAPVATAETQTTEEN